MNDLTARNQTHYCSFCRKSQYEALCLVAGPTVFICDECTEFCRDIVGKHRVQKAASVDTLPKGQDAKQGLVRSKGSAVPKGDAPLSPR